MSNILLAGGAGYIGSHTAVELLNSGYSVIVADNYSNSCPEAIKRVEKITGKPVKTYELDITNSDKLDKVFQDKRKNHIYCKSQNSCQSRGFCVSLRIKSRSDNSVHCNKKKSCNMKAKCRKSKMD